MKYEVKLGHCEVEVDAGSQEGAIKAARVELYHEWPRLYDIIMGKPDSEFEVNAN